MIERKAKILVEEQEIQRAEKKLESEVKHPADAEKFRYEYVVYGIIDMLLPITILQLNGI